MIPAFSTDAINAQFVAGQPYTLKHGAGRPVLGWLVVWRDAPGEVYVADAAADSSAELVLVPTASFNARLVLLS